MRLRHVRARGRRRARPPRPRAAPASARPSRSGAAARAPASTAPARRGCSGWRVIQPKISVDAATAPICAAARAWLRMRSGASPASTLPTADVATSGPTRWPPQRSCSFCRAVAVLVACRSRCARRRDTRRAPRRAARAPQARATGSPASSSCAAGRRRPDSRMPRTTTAAPTIAASDARGSASAAAPPAARASPAAAARAPRRAAPGRAGTGSSRSTARKRLRADATSMRPSVVRGSRTPTSSGPCTSTPFGSAMPPSRIFSSSLICPAG